MSVFKKFSGWFLRDKDIEKKYFGKDDSDKRIFYPWGKPGEAYYLTKQYESKFVIESFFFRIFVLITLFPTMFAVFAGRLDINLIVVLLALLFILSGVRYFYFVRSVHRSCQPYLEPEINRKEQKYANLKILFLYFLFFSSVVTTILKFYWLEKFSIYGVMNSFSVAVLAGFFMIFFRRLQKTKGYIFNK